MEAERYSTVHGGYGTYAREDYVIVNPSIDAHKERQDPYYAGPPAQSGIKTAPTAFLMMRSVMRSHYRALEQLGDRLMRLAGEALTNDAGAFARHPAPHLKRGRRLPRRGHRCPRWSADDGQRAQPCRTDDADSVRV